MKQATALEILKQGHCVFLTGQAGAGKTYLLNQYIAYLKQHGIKVAITASTGIAATHMNGMTIHAWSGIGIKDDLDERELVFLQKREALVERLKAVQVLVIDEVSMLHARQLDLVDKVLRFVRQDERAFGGVQLVCSGDFYQLPPVGKRGETTKDKFAFMSKAWICLANARDENMPLMKVCYLSEQHRQTDEADGVGLNDILNQIRDQDITQHAKNILNATKFNDICQNRTRLYTHNINVDIINERELEALGGKVYAYEAHYDGDPALTEMLKKNVRAYDVLKLKVGAKVMFVKNDNELLVSNGTMGEVVGFVKQSDTYLPKVRLEEGRELIVEATQWQIDDEDGEALALMAQLPLVLAWAITVHKSQGMTLSAAEVDLSQTFEAGQGYVALSRVRALAGLKLLGLNDKALLLDGFAQVANRRFLALSKECEAWFFALSETQKAAKKEQFLQANNPNYANHASSVAPSVKDKTQVAKIEIDSALLAKALNDKLSLSEIASKFALAQASVIDEIGVLLRQGVLKKEAIAYLLPDKKTQKIIKSSQKKLGSTSVPALYDELREAVDYASIRLVLVAEGLL